MLQARRTLLTEHHKKPTPSRNTHKQIQPPVKERTQTSLSLSAKLIKSELVGPTVPVLGVTKLYLCVQRGGTLHDNCARSPQKSQHKCQLKSTFAHGASFPWVGLDGLFSNPTIQHSYFGYSYTTSSSTDTALADLYICHSETEVRQNFRKEIGYHSITKGLTPSPCHQPTWKRA